jgi:hypothetical protein
MTSASGFCPSCGAARRPGDDFCFQCHATYPDRIGPPAFPDGFADWVRRGIALGLGLLILGLVVSLAWFVLGSLALLTLIRPAL